MVEELWAAVERDWENERAHRAFVEHCRVHGQLALAAQRYRRERDARGDAYRGESVRQRDAAARLARIANLAVAEVVVQEETTPRRWRAVWRYLRWPVLLFSLVILSVLIALVLGVRRG